VISNVFGFINDFVKFTKQFHCEQYSSDITVKLDRIVALPATLTHIYKHEDGNVKREMPNNRKR